MLSDPIANAGLMLALAVMREKVAELPERERRMFAALLPSAVLGDEAELEKSTAAMKAMFPRGDGE